MLPLKNIKIIDMTSVVVVPMATKILAQQGAEVMKIEPLSGDRARQLGSIPRTNMSSTHMAINAGKYCVHLDITTEKDIAILRDMIAHADILVHNFRPGVMEKKGLDCDALHAINDRLIIARITGYGQQGPKSGARAYDPVIQAESGMVSWVNGDPVLSPQYICDKNAGLYAAQAMSAALFTRERTGQASVIDISMLEAAIDFCWIDIHGQETFPNNNAPMPNIAMIYQPWQTLDGFVVAVMLSQSEFEGWAKSLGQEQIINNPDFADMPTRFQNWQKLRNICVPAAQKLSTAQLLSNMMENNVPGGECMKSEKLHHHPQIVHDEFFHHGNDDKGEAIIRPKPVAKFNGERGNIGHEAGEIGGHNSDILGQISHKVS